MCGKGFVQTIRLFQMELTFCDEKKDGIIETISSEPFEMLIEKKMVAGAENSRPFL